MSPSTPTPDSRKGGPDPDRPAPTARVHQKDNDVDIIARAPDTGL